MTKNNRLDKELRALIAKFDAELQANEKKIAALKDKSAEISCEIFRVKQMLGETIGGDASQKTRNPSLMHKRSEFHNLEMRDAIIQVLTVRGDLTRKQIAESIALPNPESIRVMHLAVCNALKTKSTKTNVFETIPVSDRPHNALVRLKKEPPNLQVVEPILKIEPQPQQVSMPPASDQFANRNTSAKAQTGLFPDTSDFSKKAMERHYPSKVKTQ